MKQVIRMVGTIALSLGVCIGCGGSSGTTAPTPAGKSWGAPVVLQQDNTTGSSYDPGLDFRLGPVVRFGPAGNAMVAWPQQGAAWDIVAVQYGVDGTWTDHGILDNSPENAFRPVFAWDGRGVGHLVWYEFDGSQYNMVARRFLPVSGWEGTITPVAFNCGETPYQTVEADGDGNVFVVWNRDPNDQNARNVIVTRFDRLSGEWDVPLAAMDNNGNAGKGKIAVTRSGIAFVAWIRYAGAYQSVQVRRSLPSAGGWEDPVTLSADNVLADDVDIAVDGTGNAIAAWSQKESPEGTPHLWTRRYVPGAGWGPEERLESDNTSRSTAVRIRMNSAGSAVAVWRHFDGVSHLWANLFDPTTGWGAAGPVETFAVEYLTAMPAAAIDPGGNAIVLWRRSDGGGSLNSLFSNRYVVGRGWGDPVPVESEPGDVGPELGLDVDPDGNAIAVWLQDDGTDPSGTRYTVRANVFR